MNEQAPSVVWRADIAVQQALRGPAGRTDTLSELAAAGNWWGGPGVIVFAAALWLGARAAGRRALAQAGLRGAEGLAIASALSGIIKGFAGRARPFVAPGEPWHWELNHGWTDARYFSMPSGHTTATIAFAVGVLLATGAMARGARLALTIPLLTSAVVVGWARLYSDQHWLSDVAFALVLGTCTSVALARLHARRVPGSYDRLMLGAQSPKAAS